MYVEKARPNAPISRRYPAITSSPEVKKLTADIRAVSERARVMKIIISTNDGILAVVDVDDSTLLISLIFYWLIPIVLPTPTIITLSPSLVFSRITCFILSMALSLESNISLRIGETASPMSSFIITAFIGK